MFLVNGSEVNITIFPDKTSQVWHQDMDKFNLDDGYDVTIEWRFESEAEVIQLVQLVDFVKSFYPNFLHLYMPYLPYGRQDKKISNDTTFALQSFAKVLNILEFDQVTTLDAHNPLACEFLIKNFKNIIPRLEIAHRAKENDIICFPDKGAKNRYGTILSFTDKLYVTCDKKRDEATGKILSIEIENCHNYIKDSKILIVDDLCDGGGTFIETAKKLKELGAKSVSLYTTHGIYSKGTDFLFVNGIDKIYNHKGEIK